MHHTVQRTGFSPLEPVILKALWFIAFHIRNSFCVTLQVLTAVKMSVVAFWVVTRGRHQRFGGTYCLHLQDFGCHTCHNPKVSSVRLVCSIVTKASRHKCNVSVSSYCLRVTIQQSIQVPFVPVSHHRGSLPCSQDSATSPYSEPDECNSHTQTLSL
jgi:hypothetical protein